MSSLQETVASGAIRTSGYSYDLSGNIVAKALPNGEMTVKSYDALNRVAVIEDFTPTQQRQYSYTQSYDPAGNVTKVAEVYVANSGNRVVSNTYDAINRLTQEVATGSAGYNSLYTYDQGNNRTQWQHNGITTTYVYNNLNQLLRSISNPTATAPGSVTTYTYDLNGNRSASTHNGRSDTYSYDYENRLILITKATPTPPSTQVGTFRYAYDYRTRRILRDESAAAGSHTRLVFSGGTSVQEYDNDSTTPTVEYVRGSDYGGGIGGIWYTLRGGVPSYTHYNSRGDVVAKTASTGAVTYQAQYEAFGAQTQTTGATLDRQKSNSKDTDPTGLVDEGFRYRDLETGSFITRDPAGMIDGPNLYAYVNQNPWTKFDPEGLDSSNTPPPTAQGSTPKPAPPAAPSPSASATSPKLVVGIELPDKTAISGNTLNVALSTGHTFVYMKDDTGKLIAVHSFGPAVGIGAVNKLDFKDGKIGGNPNFGISGQVDTWEFNITPAQLSAGEKAEASFKASPPHYTPTCQCTTTSVAAAAAAGVKLPDGVGPVIAEKFYVNGFSGNVSNPYHLDQQMTSSYGPPTVIDSSKIPPTKK